jgi:cytochrome c-type biogenesis protein CcmH
MKGRPTELVKKALQIDPKNAKALVLAGTAAFERKEFSEAIAQWGRAREGTSDETLRQQIDASMAAAQAAASGASAPQASAGASAAVSGAKVSGQVSLAVALAGKAPPDASVFIFARPAQGSRMPVALLRKKVSDLPLVFTLDDSMAMVPGSGLSQQTSVVIVARVSMRGDVMPQPGDLQGTSAAVPVGSKGVTLEVAEVLK